ncbi:hypothetical protein MKR81_08930 [Vibrio campbellii]|uniref:hypothetical protein n=1 Tax=Vibrio campbellii TaxID=680 RepID=UPI001F086BED|nr:hypothetical protein [Vibrio campbellii]UMM01709.1 hypothetical protein MKR81_08930 [Vibrio campbellii]
MNVTGKVSSSERYQGIESTKIVEIPILSETLLTLPIEAPIAFKTFKCLSIDKEKVSAMITIPIDSSQNIGAVTNAFTLEVNDFSLLAEMFTIGKVLETTTFVWLSSTPISSPLSLFLIDSIGSDVTFE